MQGALRIRSYLPGDERGIVEVLNAVFPGGWGSVEDWTWKHRERDGFDPETIFVAEQGDRIVGCWHAVIEELRLGDVRLRVGFEGDTAVLPEYRGGAIVLRVHDRINAVLAAKGALLRAGSATPDLADGFYGPMFGYLKVPMPVRTKALDNRPLRNAIDRLGRRVSLGERVDLEIQFRLSDLAPFVLRVAGGALSTENGSTGSPDLEIVGDQGSVVGALRGRARGGNKLGLLRSLLTGRVRVRGWLRNALPLCRLLAAMIRDRRSTAKLGA